MVAGCLDWRNGEGGRIRLASGWGATLENMLKRLEKMERRGEVVTGVFPDLVNELVQALFERGESRREESEEERERKGGHGGVFSRVKVVCSPVGEQKWSNR